MFCADRSVVSMFLMFFDMLLGLLGLLKVLRELRAEATWVCRKILETGRRNHCNGWEMLQMAANRVKCKFTKFHLKAFSLVYKTTQDVMRHVSMYSVHNLQFVHVVHLCKLRYTRECLESLLTACDHY